MALHILADQSAPLPEQLVLDSSFLLALRPTDDNPQAEVVQAFARHLRRRVAAIATVAWLVMPVLQECYHIILAGSLRRTWQELDPAQRPANWLALYKRDPDTLKPGLLEVERFDTLLATFPVTLAQPQDLAASQVAGTLDERLRYFMARYRLLPQDALILAATERLGAKAVATLDRDWHRDTEFDIYTTSI